MTELEKDVKDKFVTSWRRVCACEDSLGRACQKSLRIEDSLGKVCEESLKRVYGELENSL